MHLIKDGRTCIAMPWTAQTPTPWSAGYSRVFIPFTETERKNAKCQTFGHAKQGHIQVVRNKKLKD